VVAQSLLLLLLFSSFNNQDTNKNSLLSNKSTLEITFKESFVLLSNKLTHTHTRKQHLSDPKQVSLHFLICFLFLGQQVSLSSFVSLFLYFLQENLNIFKKKLFARAFFAPQPINWKFASLLDSVIFSFIQKSTMLCGF